MLSVRASKTMDEGIIKNGLELYLNYRNGYDTVNQSWNNLVIGRSPSYLTNGGNPPLVSEGVSFNGSNQYSSFASNIFAGKKDYSIDVFLYPPLDTAQRIAFSYYYSTFQTRIGCNSSGKPEVSCMIANTFYYLTAPTAIVKESLITFTIGTTGMRLYVNGNLVASNTIASVTIPACDRITVGANQDNTTSTRSMYYKGIISLLRVYNRELSAGEVIQNYSALTSIGL